MLTIRVLIDQGNSERTILLAVDRLPRPGDILDLPDGGSCLVNRADPLTGDPAVVDAFVSATLNR